MVTLYVTDCSQTVGKRKKRFGYFFHISKDYKGLLVVKTLDIFQNNLKKCIYNSGTLMF